MIVSNLVRTVLKACFATNIFTLSSEFYSPFKLICKELLGAYVSAFTIRSRYCVVRHELAAAISWTHLHRNRLVDGDLRHLASRRSHS